MVHPVQSIVGKLHAVFGRPGSYAGEGVYTTYIVNERYKPRLDFRRQQSGKCLLDSGLHSVVCLRGGKRGTCLGPPLRCYAHKFFLFLVKNALFTHIMCYKAGHKQVLCFQSGPHQKLECAGILLSRGPQTPPKCASLSTLLSNFIAGSLKETSV